MFTQEDKGSQVRVRTLDGDIIEGKLVDVTDELCYVIQSEATDPQEIKFNKISTVTRIGQFGGE